MVKRKRPWKYMNENKNHDSTNKSKLIRVPLANARGHECMMVSCVSGKERIAAREIVEWLELVSEKAGMGNHAEHDTEQDEKRKKMSVRDAIQDELLTESSNARKFQCVEMGALRGMFLIKILDYPLGSAVKLAELVSRDKEEQGKNRSRFCFKLLPLTNMCIANVESITNCFRPLIQEYFRAHDDTDTFAVFFERRFDKLCDRMEVIDGVVKIVHECFENKTLPKVDLENPKVTLVVQVFKNIAGVSILPKFDKKKSFDLRVA